MSEKLPTITQRAAQAIKELVEKYAPSGTEAYMPIICWMVESNQLGFVPGPCLALEVEGKVPGEFIVESHGLKVGFNLPEAKLTENQDCALDFLGDRFVFIPKGIGKFLD